MMTFNYLPVFYKDIKENIGRQIRKDTQTYKMLCLSKNCDKSIGDVLERLGKKKRCFTDKIVWDDDVMPTIKSDGAIFRGEEKTAISIEDIIHAQTFPIDYNFGSYTFGNVAYICGMSVPPVMIKRIVTRLIEQGVFSK